MKTEYRLPSIQECYFGDYGVVNVIVCEDFDSDNDPYISLEVEDDRTSYAIEMTVEEFNIFCDKIEKIRRYLDKIGA